MKTIKNNLEALHPLVMEKGYFHLTSDTLLMTLQ